MLTLSVAPERAEYVAKEEVLVTLTIQNTGPDPIELADPSAPIASQPVYFITGPSFPDGRVASPRSAAEERTGPLAPALQPERISISPGGVWKGQAALGQMFGQLLPGEYRLQTALDWQGSRVRSQETQLRVNPADPVSFDVGQGLRLNDRAQGRLVFLNRAVGGTTLMAGRFSEVHPDIGEIRTAAPIAQFTAGSSAVDVSAAWRNIAFFSELVQWTVWREGRQIKAISDASTEAISLTLPTDPAFLVRPSLKLKDQPVEALVLGKDQQLYLCAFPTDLNPNSRPKIVWHSPIPVVPDGVTAALAPAGNDSRHVAFAVTTSSGVEIYHSSYRGNSLVGFQSVRVPNVRLTTNIPPALMVDTNGVARVTVIVTKDSRSYSAIEARFKESGHEGSSEMISLGTLEHPVISGRVLYIDKAGEFRHREIAVVVDDGTGRVTLRWTQSGAWKKLPAQVTPAIPMILVAGESFSYVLCFEAKRGFFFEPL